MPVRIVGGGLAGSEAAWQVATRGVSIMLHEMRPVRPTAVHHTDSLAELVCSNSFKSDVDGSAPHQLKWELRRCGSLLISIADAVRVPAGAALAVDRERFCAAVTERISGHPAITVTRMEVGEVPAGQIAVIATGPLTSPFLSRFIEQLTGEKSLYFYDAISPIVEADSISWDHVFQSSRYGRNMAGQAGAGTGDGAGGHVSQAGRLPSGAQAAAVAFDEGDYINCPMTAGQYRRFYGELIRAESVPVKDFERALYFESCLPIEELARRGQETLRFGPMKPVGLTDPTTGRQPYAVVQLRQENLIADAYNMVGFQNHLRYGEQERIFRLIPGLERAEFIRLGQIHRNTFVNAPRLLGPTLQLRRRPEIYFAGQICGVEGYVESMAMGLVAGWNALRQVCGRIPVEFPRETAIGSLLHYLTEANAEHFQPMNINFGLLPALGSGGRKEERRRRQLEIGRKALDALIERSEIEDRRSQIEDRKSQIAGCRSQIEDGSSG